MNGWNDSIKYFKRFEVKLTSEKICAIVSELLLSIKIFQFGIWVISIQYKKGLKYACYYIFRSIILSQSMLVVYKQKKYSSFRIKNSW